jgi:endonuclease/exonuclease/phosphatase family metal-dependent hydrolase
MRLLSWNVQWCRGVDGKVDPARIAAELRRIADPDVACFQEIASTFVDLPGR